MAVLLYYILFFIILFPPGIRYTLGDWAYGTPQSAELNDNIRQHHNLHFLCNAVITVIFVNIYLNMMMILRSTVKISTKWN